MRADELLLVLVASEGERPLGLPVKGSEVLVCGVGKAAAAVATARRLAGGGVGAVVSFGVGGCYPGSGLRVGDVVVADRVAILDEGLQAAGGFRPLRIPGVEVPGSDWAPTHAALRDLCPAGDVEAFRVVHGAVGTVSVCAGTARLVDERAATGAVAEAMEGAAAALAAAASDVPFLEIRGISNPCGDRDVAPFDLPLAVAHASIVLAALATALPRGDG